MCFGLIRLGKDNNQRRYGLKISPVQNYSTPNFKGFNAGSLLSKAANINSWQQRTALGLAAITFQPIIDLTNKDVDKDTRRISANRSFAKGLVGAATGIAIRGGCMKVVEKAFENEKFTNSIAKYTAENFSEEAIEKSKDFIKNQGGAKKYAAVIGTITALGVMLATNFLIDAPVTNWLTNKMNEKYEKDTENTDNQTVPQNTEVVK